MRIIRKGLFNIIRYLNITALLFMFLILLLQVFTRKVLNSPLPWPEELALLSMIWITFLGSYQVTVEKKHLKMDFLQSKIPTRYQPIMMIISQICVAVFLIFVNMKAYPFIKQAGSTSMPVSGIPMWVPYGLIWISAILMLMETIIQIIQESIKFSKGNIEGEEDKCSQS